MKDSDHANLNATHMLEIDTCEISWTTLSQLCKAWQGYGPQQGTSNNPEGSVRLSLNSSLQQLSLTYKLSNRKATNICQHQTQAEGNKMKQSTRMSREEVAKYQMGLNPSS